MKKVLIVEDEKDIREILEDIFRKDLGFEQVTFAADGLEGYTEAYLQKFDIICTDHTMPFCKGSDMVRAIRTKEGLNQSTPIIMISAFITEFAEKMSATEKIYFVEKPIDFARLSRYVKMAISNKVPRLERDSV